MLDLLLSPASWQKQLARLKLKPNDCILDFQTHHWQQPELRRLLWRSVLLEPLISACLILLGLSFFTWEWKYLQLGLVCGVTWHVFCLLWLGLFHSLAAARIVGLAGGLAMGWSLCGFHIGFLWLLALLFVMLGIGLVARDSAPARLLSLSKHCAGAAIVGLLIRLALLWLGYQGRFFSDDPFAGSLIGICLILGLGLGASRRSWRLAVFAGIALPLLGGAFLASPALAESGLPSWLVYALNDAALSAILASVLSALPVLSTIATARGGQRKTAAPPIVLLLATLYALLAYYQNAPAWQLGFGLGALLLGLSYPLWLPVLLYPFEELWNYALYAGDTWYPTRPPGGRFSKHSVWWHERQYLRRYSLWHYLVWLWQYGQVPEDLLARYPWLNKRVMLECDTRLLESAHDVQGMAQCNRRLSGDYDVADAHASLLRRFRIFSRDIATAFAQTDSYRQRLLLLDVEERLNHLGTELQQQNRNLARRFQKIAVTWRKAVLHAADDLALISRKRREIENPYIVGIPLTTKESVFIERTDVLVRIEKLLWDRYCPPILLYGQRRTGKTSLLHNLQRLMSSRLVFVYMDLQSPRFMTGDLGQFLTGVTDIVRRALPEMPEMPVLRTGSDVPRHIENWLDSLDTVLAGRILLAAVDEFAILEEARQRGQLPENVLFTLLNTLRHVIQHRPNIRFILAGSNTLDELQGWAAYLINAQTVRLGYLSDEGARRLIEHPQPDFSLRYSAEAVTRILKVTRGHPALMQLLCSELVEYKNSQAEIDHEASLADVEAAMNEALSSGAMLFSDLAFNQIDREALALALDLARQGEDALLSGAQLGESQQPALRQLLKRDILEAHETGYRFQIEMFRRGMLALAG